MNEPRPLAVVLVEDSEDDALLVELALRRAGWQLRLDRCQDEPTFRSLLAAGGLDLVISDYALPAFSGLAALAIVRDHDPELPFILVSGTIGEDAAVQAMRAGAHDYLMKGNLARLIPAVERELREAEGRRHRRLAERRLAESERLQRTILESIGEAVLALDAVGTVVRANRAAGNLLGQPPTQLAGQPFAAVVRLLDPVTRQPLPDPVATALTGMSVDSSLPTLLDLGPDRSRRVEVGVHPLRSDDGAVLGAVLALRDVTERFDHEQDLRQAQKLSALGQLAGSVAHDFNNLLTIVLGQATMLAVDPGLSGRSRERLGQISQAAERGVALVARMVSFARKGSLEPQVFPLDPEVRAVADLFAGACQRNLRVELALGADAATITGFPTQVHSALLNLLVNARDAQPQGGLIRVSTDLVVLDQETAARARPALAAGRWLRIAVADAGTGISPAVMPRLFEPFLTTKQPGKGTGLGLPSVLGCARDHQGGVLVDSVVGTGTTMTVLFPFNAG